MSKKVLKYSNKTFDSIKHLNEYDNEYWEARELMIILEYALWQNFHKVIIKAITTCKLSKVDVHDHFIEVNKMVKTGDSNRKIIDYHLSRYACYLIVQNADSNKEVVALGQTYFAIQTRKQELSEKEYDLLTEDEKRFYQRNLTKQGNNSLQYVAKNAGVKNMDQFHNAGYKGLYNGEAANDIAKRKGLRYREDILDNMNSDELAVNHFRIVQAKQKIQNENIKGEKNAKEAHFEIGAKVRKAIADMGGTMPEKLPTPNKSIKQLQKEKSNKKIKNY